MTPILRSGTTIRPVRPTMKPAMAASPAMAKAANPHENPFWAEYITVTRPSSAAIIDATPRYVRTERPATT